MKAYIAKVLLVLIAAVLLFMGVCIAVVTLPGKMAERKKIELSAYAKTIEEMEIPGDVCVVGIGEATHGNVEFQMLKLTVLQKMVAEGKCRSVAFEMPACDGARLDACVADLGISAEETVKELMYNLYCTREMVALVTWIQEYNQQVGPAEQIRIYGIDMQGAEDDAVWVANSVGEEVFAQLTEQEKSRVHAIAQWNTAEEITWEETDRALFEKLLSVLQDGEDIQLIFNTQVVLERFDKPSFEEDANAYGEYRDQCMAQNTQLVQKSEAERGFPQIVLTGHNGHLMKGDAVSYGEKPLGQRLAECYGKDYFVIGTEFFHADVNIHTAGTYGEDYERKNHYFCSADSIAAQAQYQDAGMFYLDYAKITDTDSELYQRIHQESDMGLVGEGYTDWMMVTMSYRTRVVPAERYDGVIYVYHATPIDPM